MMFMNMFDDNNISDIKEVKLIKIWEDNTLNYVVLEMNDSKRHTVQAHQMGDKLKNYLKGIIRDEKLKSLL